VSGTTTDLWAEERAAYLDHLAWSTKRDRLDQELAELEWRVGRRLAGRRYARQLGLPPALSDVVGVLVLSPSPDARVRAAALVVRALQRAAGKAA